MQNVWTFSIPIDGPPLEQPLSQLSEQITTKQDECHNMGMTATITAVSHDICRLDGHGDVLSAVVAVTVTPSSTTDFSPVGSLVHSLPQPVSDNIIDS